MAREEFRVDLTADNDISKEAKKAKKDLDAIPDRVETTIDVESSGLDDIADKLGGLPGQFGEIGGALGAAAGPAAAGGIAVAMFQAANSAKELALEAKTTADLTGSTVEEASKLQKVWTSTGADVNDLNDVLLQMNGALAQSPELAAQLGVNLNDGKNIQQRFVELTDKLAAGQLTAVQASQLFGEEGVRQVGKLRTVYGGLSDDLENMPPPIDDDDVAKAVEMEKAMNQLKAGIGAAALEAGQKLIPVFTDAAEIALKIGENLPGDGSDQQKTKGLLDKYFEWGTGIGLIGKGLEGVNTLLGEQADLSTEGVTESINQWGTLHRAYTDTADALPDVIDSQSELGDAVAETRGELEVQVAAIFATMDAEEKLASARRAHADSAIAAREAQRKFVESLTKGNEVLADSESTLYDAAAAMDETAASAADSADAQVQLAVDTFAAQGKVVSATSQQSLWNQAMLQSASTATGPLRDAIIGYIATVNGIPPEKVSEIVADPDYQSINAAANALDAAAKDRDANIFVRLVGAGAAGAALGGIAGTTRTATAPAPAAMSRTAAPAATSTQTFNISLNAAVYGDPYAVQRAVTKAVRGAVRLGGARQARAEAL